MRNVHFKALNIVGTFSMFLRNIMKHLFFCSSNRTICNINKIDLSVSFQKYNKQKEVLKCCNIIWHINSKEIVAYVRQSFYILRHLQAPAINPFFSFTCSCIIYIIEVDIFRIWMFHIRSFFFFLVNFY